VNDWSTWQTTIPALFAGLMGIPCHWADQPRQMVMGARAQIDIIATPAFGVDDRLRTEDLDTGELTESAVGQREMVLQVSVWNASQSLATAARQYVERLRTRMHFESTQVALKALELSFRRCEAPVDLDGEEDGRTVSRCAMDVRLGYAWRETDAENPGTWIETGRITANTITDVDDTDLPDALQIDINPPES